MDTLKEHEATPEGQTVPTHLGKRQMDARGCEHHTPPWSSRRMLQCTATSLQNEDLCGTRVHLLHPRIGHSGTNKAAFCPRNPGWIFCTLCIKLTFTPTWPSTQEEWGQLRTYTQRKGVWLEMLVLNYSSGGEIMQPRLPLTLLPPGTAKCNMQAPRVMLVGAESGDSKSTGKNSKGTTSIPPQ